MPEILTASCACSLVLLTTIWNIWVGLRWQSFNVITPYAMAILVAIALFAASRAIWRLAEISAYFLAWQVFTLFSVRLTYLAFALGNPLQDRTLIAFDAVIGFDWVSWARFVALHSTIGYIQSLAYLSITIQVPILIVVSALRFPRVRNAETFTSISLALVITVAIAAFIPAIGPGDTLGLRTDVGPVVPVVRALQGGAANEPLPYVGIVAFPSFHTIMAIQFAYALRGLGYVSLAAATLNIVMLTSVPFHGDHHLIDVLAGAVVAVVAIRGAKVPIRMFSKGLPTITGTPSRQSRGGRW